MQPQQQQQQRSGRLEEEQEETVKDQRSNPITSLAKRCFTCSTQWHFWRAEGLLKWVVLVRMIRK